MYRDRSILLGRLARMRRDCIQPARRRAVAPVAVTAWVVPDELDGGPGEPVPVAVADAAEFAPITPGDQWGRPWSTTWLRVQADLPAGFDGDDVELSVDLGFDGLAPGFAAEGLVWERSGGGWVPWRGVHPLAHQWPLAASWRESGRLDLLIEAAANPLIDRITPDPNTDRLTARTEPLYHFVGVELVAVSPQAVALEHDLDVLLGLLLELPEDSSRAQVIEQAIRNALDALDPFDVSESAGAARSQVAGALAAPAVASAQRIVAVGHAHIDTAWLWPLRETRRKSVRTFANVIRLLDERPDLRFVCSQAVQYSWVEQDHPELFDQIRAQVAAGRWIPVGGNWVEADGNVPTGESLVRQFLHGQRYFQSRFGVTCREQWIPDVFGYPASLPQIFRLAGANRFITQKLSWNRTNPFPHHTFWWEGLDGSRVFTHFPPVETYNASMVPVELVHSERTFRDRPNSATVLMPFGFGDGGGGPNRDMLERFDRVADLEGLPTVRLGTPDEFFAAAMDEYPDPPVWVGELYFENHRGTYTSQARTKVAVRRAERLLRELELWWVAAHPGQPLPEQVDDWWKTVLVHQFHDILPGSSIAWVHREAEAVVGDLIAQVEALVVDTIRAVPVTETSDPGLGGTAPVVVANAATGPRVEVIEVPAALAGSVPAALAGSLVEQVDALAVLTQMVANGSVAVRVQVDGLSVADLAAAIEPAAAVEPVRVETVRRRTVLDNGLLRVTFGADGCVSSLLADGREVLAAGGRGALVQIHHDLPLEYDAWDIEEYAFTRSEDCDAVESIDVLDAGPLVARVAVRRRFRSSRITQTFRLAAGSDRLDVDVDLDWHERDQLLKIAWPVDVLCDEIRREIAFGHVRSAIHRNTSWDHARFEVCAHRWVDAAEPGFGVAMLCDGRFGWDVRRTRSADGLPSTTLRLSAAKGAQFPDPLADEGAHHFRYAVLPHGGDVAPVVAAADAFCTPLRVIAARATPAAESFRASGSVLAVDRPDRVTVAAVKPAEDASGDVVVRLYEHLGGRAQVTLRPGWSWTSVTAVDLLEAPHPPSNEAVLTSVPGESVTVAVRPFQILTLRFS